MSINVTVTETPSVDLSISSSTGLNVGVGGTSHNSLVGIQGGDTGEYYHLTLGQYNQIGGDPDAFVNITGSETISGVKSFESGFIVNAGGQDIFVTGNLDGSERKLYIDADSLIVGENEVNSLYSAIIVGSGNQIFGDYDVIIGGELNVISGNEANPSKFGFIGAGSHNDILSSNYSVIGGGQHNKIEDATVSFIGGGATNEIYDPVSAIVGGNAHIISGGNGYSFIGGGEENKIYGTFSSVLGGEGNKVYGGDAVTLGGWFTESSGQFALVGPGRSSKVSGDYAVALGNKVEIPVAHSGATVLADGQDRVHASSAAHTATLDFANGVYVNGGDLNVEQDITMAGETVATRTWVQSQETSQRFDTVLPSGIDETGIEFSTVFSSAPMVQCELQLPSGGERTYFLAVRDITTTGFFVEFSDNIGTGYILQTRSIPNT